MKRNRDTLIMHYRDLIHREEEWWGLDHMNWTDEEVLDWRAGMSKPGGGSMTQIGNPNI